MAVYNQTHYCCKYSERTFSESVTGGCIGIWSIEIDSATSNNTFAPYTNSYILSRTCAELEAPICFEGSVSGRVLVGCVPQSLFPIEVDLTLKRDNIVEKTFKLIILNGLDCFNCESMCGVLS